MSAARLVRISDFQEARAALAHGRLEAVLVTAEGLAAFAGVGFWRAVAEALGHPILVDCGEDAGLVMAGLRAGCRDLLFTGPAPVAAKLADMAAQLGGQLHRGLQGNEDEAPRQKDVKPDT